MPFEIESNQRLIEDVQDFVNSRGIYGALRACTIHRPDGVVSWWEIIVPEHARFVNHKDAQRVRMPVDNPEVLDMLAEARVCGSVQGVYEQRGETLELLHYEVVY